MAKKVPVAILVKKIKPRYAIQFGRYKGGLGYFVVDTKSIKEDGSIKATFYKTKSKALKKMPPDQPFKAVTEEGSQWILAAKKFRLRRVRCVLMES